jgi:NitT/TauT family transport system permease protein
MPFGLLIGAYRPIDRLLAPLAGAFRYLPAPAFIPLLLMWLGTGEGQKIALLVIGVVFFLIIMIADVTRQVPRVYTETARTLGLRPIQILGSVIFRASLAGYVDVFRQLLAVSWTYLVIAEIVAATDGIGAMMMRAKRFVHVDDIMAGILVIGLLGLLFDALFKALHRGAFRYLQPNQ